MWPASATTASRAPGMPAATRLGASATGRIQRAGDDQRRGADLRQAVVEGLHGPLPRPPQARGETGRPVAEALGAQTGGAGGRQRGMAGEDRFALPLVDEGIDPVALEPFGARFVRGPARLPLGRRREARGRALEDEASHDRRMRDGQAQGDPRAERVAQDVRRREARPGQDRREIVRRALDARRVPGPTASPIGRAPGGRPRPSGTTWRRPSRARPQLDPRPVNPWRRSSGTPVPRARTSQRRPSTSTLIAARWRRRRRRPPRDGARRCARGPCGTQGPAPPVAPRSRPGRPGWCPDRPSGTRRQGP